MKSMPIRIATLVLLSLAMLGLSASRAEPPKRLYLGVNTEFQRPTPPTEAAVYVKKDTWHQSMLASLEATFGSMVQKDRAAQSGGFRPAMVRPQKYAII